jgi:hypothetical protein
LIKQLAEVESQYQPQRENPLDYHIPCQPTDAWSSANPGAEIRVIGSDDFCSIVPFTIFPASWVIFSHLSLLTMTEASDCGHLARKHENLCFFLLNLADVISFEGLSSCSNSVSRLHVCFALKIVADFSQLRSQRDAAEACLIRMGCDQFL